MQPRAFDHLCYKLLRLRRAGDGRASENPNLAIFQNYFARRDSDHHHHQDEQSHVITATAMSASVHAADLTEHLLDDNMSIQSHQIIPTNAVTNYNELNEDDLIVQIIKLQDNLRVEESRATIAASENQSMMSRNSMVSEVVPNSDI